MFSIIEVQKHNNFMYRGRIMIFGTWLILKESVFLIKSPHPLEDKKASSGRDKKSML